MQERVLRADMSKPYPFAPLIEARHVGGTSAHRCTDPLQRYSCDFALIGRQARLQGFSGCSDHDIVFWYYADRANFCRLLVPQLRFRRAVQINRRVLSQR
jgi:hypothetical protein